MDRKRWFEERIGKTVYRTKTSCMCSTCNIIYEDGLKIIDKEHANYAYDMEGLYEYEGLTLKYFDTIKERDIFEKSLKEL